MTCDICGVAWQRHRMRRKRDGLWYCPDDYPGIDPVSLAAITSRQIDRSERFKSRPDGANWDTENGAGAVTAITDPEDIGA